jgi:hypothetical protein
VKAVDKRQMKLSKLIMKAYATVYGQCLQEVKDKLRGSDNWERIQHEQSLHKLVQMIEWICVASQEKKVLIEIYCIEKCLLDLDPI